MLGWLLLRRLLRRRSFDAVLDCQNGIPFFTPCVLPRRVPVLCVVHHVHTSQFALHFPAWLARAGQLLEGPAARLVYRRHTCVAVSPSTVTASAATPPTAGRRLFTALLPEPAESEAPGAFAPSAS